MTQRHANLTGDAGEHYVAYCLARLGIDPALLRKNSKGADVLATIGGSRVLSLQVKASAARSEPRQWIVGKHKPDVSDNFMYIFLNINSLNNNGGF